MKIGGAVDMTVALWQLRPAVRDESESVRDWCEGRKEAKPSPSVGKVSRTITCRTRRASEIRRVAIDLTASEPRLHRARLGGSPPVSTSTRILRS